MKSVIFSLILSSFLAFSPAMAEDHAPATITGSGIQLFERNHGFAGEINSTPVFGVFDHQPFGSQISIRKGESTLVLKMTEANGQYLGQLVEDRVDEATGKSIQVVTSVELASVKKTGALSGEINLKIDGQNLVVAVTGETFANNHFQKPSFSATVNGQLVQFNFTGEACFGYSSSMAMMIFGAMTHIAK